MLRSRLCKPYQNQSIAESRYALQETTDTPAASPPTQMVSTCGTVISMVKIDMLPSRRPNSASPREPSLMLAAGSGATKSSGIERSGPFCVDVGEHPGAHVVGDGHRLERVERHHRHLVAGAELLVPAHAAADVELDRGAAQARDRQLEDQGVAEVAGAEELAAGADDREADPPLEVHLLEGLVHRLAEPVLDDPRDHLEEVDEKDDSGRVAMRKADQALGGERLGHLPQSSHEKAARGLQRFAAQASATTGCATAPAGSARRKSRKSPPRQEDPCFRRGWPAPRGARMVDGAGPA